MDVDLHVVHGKYVMYECNNIRRDNKILGTARLARLLSPLRPQKSPRRTIKIIVPHLVSIFQSFKAFINRVPFS